jgi:hypothetical protein
MTAIKIRRNLFVSALLVVSLVAGSGVASGHAEREASFPDGTGKVPTYRPMIASPNLVVCTPTSLDKIRTIRDPKLRAANLKLIKRCRFRNVQDAVRAVTERGTTIYMLPGIYREKPFRAQPRCAKELAQSSEDEGAPILSYEQQMMCPQAQNLIGIFGDNDPADDKRECNAAVCDLQIEGTGQRPEDVRITGGFTKDGQWMKLNGIRADRADGIYMKNFTVELFEFNAIYILETDGFVIDEVVGRWNDEYAYLTFAVDHGLYKNCEGYNNGDSAIYPGSASDVNTGSEEYSQKKRWSVEIRNCKSHHNAAGYSGTAGNSVYVHDNDFYANQSGMVTDSIYPDHPGLPQDHAWVTGNRFFSNNVNYVKKYVQSGICDKPPAKRGYKPKPGKPKWSGTVCPVIPAPVGAGMVIAGGNWNLMEKNHVWDNWRAGYMLIAVPAAIRNEPDKGFDTSHFNRYVNNFMSVTPRGKLDLNGVDFWWDDQGEGNCWQGNKTAKDWAITTNTMYPNGLPDCDSGGSVMVPSNPYKTGQIAACATYDRDDPELRDPPGCDFFDTPEEPKP